jgi:hypothetical protein
LNDDNIVPKYWDIFVQGKLTSVLKEQATGPYSANYKIVTCPCDHTGCPTSAGDTRCYNPKGILMADHSMLLFIKAYQSYQMPIFILELLLQVQLIKEK